MSLNENWEQGRDEEKEVITRGRKKSRESERVRKGREKRGKGREQDREGTSYLGGNATM